MLLENNPYPQDARVRREATSLTRAGYAVGVIAPAASGQPRSEHIAGVRVYRYPPPPDGRSTVGYLVEYGYSLLAAAVLTLYVALTRGFDVLHAHNPPDTFVLLAALFKPFGKQFVFDHHDLSPEMYVARFGKAEAGGPAVRLLQVFEKLSFRLADHVISTNESYRAVAIERGGVAPARVSVVRNGPDLDRVRLVAPDEVLRARAPSIIGYVGEMGFQDGVDYLLRALHHLKVDLGRRDFYAVLIGSGDAAAELARLSAELELEDCVRLTGRVSDEMLMRYLSTADICVDPDPSNPFNDRSTMIKMTEYLALGKPVVAFDLPEHRVTAGEAAVYAASNSEMDFAAKLAALMDDPQRRKAMGEIGRARVAEHLAWEHQAPRLVAAYESLAGSRRRDA
jgi:glycosyltransferase involved in cell wall biosynthesis